MYVRLKTSRNIVALPEDFLTLLSAADDVLVFDAKYRIDQDLAVKLGCTNVTLEICKELPPTVSSVTARTKLDPLSTRTFFSKHEELLTKYRTESIVTEKSLDPTTHISNEAVTLLKRGYSSSQLPQLQSKTLVRVDATGKPPMQVQAQHDLSEVPGMIDRTLAEKLLLLGLDPSDAYKSGDLGLTLHESFSGTRTKSAVVVDSVVDKLKYAYKNVSRLKPINVTSPGEPGTTQDVRAEEAGFAATLERANVDPRWVDVVRRVDMRLAKDTPDRMLFVLKVRDGSGLVVQTLVRSFFPREHRKNLFVPIKAPELKLSVHQSRTTANLAIRQTDPIGTMARVFVKVQDHNSLSSNAYEQLDDVPITIKDGWKYVPVKASVGNTLVYRVVSLGPFGAIGSDFASVVVNPSPRKNVIRRMSVVVTPQVAGAQLEVSSLPNDCVSFTLSREDVTTHSDLVKVSSPVYVDASAPLPTYFVSDSGLKAGHLYRYHCEIMKKSGSTFRRAAVLYEHNPLVENLVDTSIVDAVTTLVDGGYDVKFKIKTNVLSTNVDQLKLLLEKQGMFDLFKDDVKDVRTELGKLLAHKVTRTDLTTGEIEEFGTVTSDEFSDATLRGPLGISELRSGRKYRYTIVALLRAPETMLETFKKSAIDSNTTRTYSYSPFKFLHPLVSSTGALVTPSSIQTHYAKDPMTFGFVGNSATTEVALDKQRPFVVAATKERLGSNTEILKWTLRGSPSDVDHFQILTGEAELQKVVARATCVPGVSGFTFVRKMKEAEATLDERVFVAPVYMDYSVGQPVPVSSANRSDEI